MIPDAGTLEASPSTEAIRLIRSADLVIWDFDGVIKESVQVKTDAFAALFDPFGPAVSERVVAHHRANGGMSRYHKLPVYLEWAGVEPTAEAVDEYCSRFASLVVHSVIRSAWVPGVFHYLTKNPNGQRFTVVTATPEEEIISILGALEIDHVFERVFGAPTTKDEGVAASLGHCGVTADRAVVVGDASADLEAARINRVAFVLRRTPENGRMVMFAGSPAVNDFRELK